MVIIVFRRVSGRHIIQMLDTKILRDGVRILIYNNNYQTDIISNVNMNI